MLMPRRQLLLADAACQSADAITMLALSSADADSYY